MAQHKIAESSDFETEESCVIEEIEGIEVAVYRIQGEYHALANFCPHQSGPLCEGELKGRMVPGDDGWEWKYDSEKKIVLCPWHGWQFDVTTATNTDDTSISVPKFDVVEKDDGIYVTV